MYTMHYADYLKSDMQKQNGDTIFIFTILEILIKHERRQHREVTTNRNKNS